MIKSTFSPQQQVRLLPYYLGHFLLYLGLVSITFAVAWLGFKSVRGYLAYQATAAHLAGLETVVSLDPELPALAQLQDSVRQVAEDLDLLQREAAPFLPLMPYLGWMPVYGGDLQALPHLLPAGRDLGRVALLLVDTLAPLLEPQPDGFLPALVVRLSQVEPELAQAELLLRQHQAAITAIDVRQLSPQIASPVNQLQQHLPGLLSGLRMVRELPAALGAESPQTYLILMQNSDELRPSGGYITAAGHLVFDQGRVAEFVMQDSYAVDRLSELYPYPPRPLYDYMAADYWVLRDASWSPDFPTTARAASYLYRLGQETSASGVIALDQHALSYLLRAFRPFEVQGELVASDNVIELIRRHWAPEVGQNLDRAWWAQRKSFMLALAETIRWKFERDMADIDLPVLVSALEQALVEKHLLVYLETGDWNEVLGEKNWNGMLQPTQGDYLMAVDANVGFNKASALVERRLSYQVVLARDGSAQGQVRLAYQHPAPKHQEQCSIELRYDPVYRQNMERCYWNYLRLIVPAGAQLTNGPGVVVAGQYLLRGQPTSGKIDTETLAPGKKGWGQLFLLAPRDATSLDYTYTLPPSTARPEGNTWTYTLYLQKQPGTLASEVEVTVRLPAGARLVSSRSLPSSQDGELVSYRLNLATDRKISLSYTLP